jgi:hypothetical protein
MSAGSFHNKGTGCTEPRIRRNYLWIAILYTSECQRLFREIQASDIGILIDIAQDICKLKRATKMVGQSFPVTVIHAEYAHTQPSNRAGYSIAIKIKLIETRPPDIRARIHLHAIDDG